MTNQLFTDPFKQGLPGDLARQSADRILAGPHLSVLTTVNGAICLGAFALAVL